MRDQSCFCVGDRVIAVRSVDGWSRLKGKHGRVVDIFRNGFPNIGVEFDEYFGGHDANGHGKDGFCRYGLTEDFVLEEEPVVAIDFSFEKLFE